MIVVSEDQIRAVLDPQLAFDAVRNVFKSMESGAWNFPVVREALGYQDALYGFKSGFDPSSGALGLKSGGYWPNNSSVGIANHQSTIFLFDPDTGQCQAAMGGNVITALRTAAAAAVSIDILARPDVRILGLIGTGHQSPFQLEAALRVRDFTEVRIWNRSQRSLERHHQIAVQYGVKCREVTLEEAIVDSDTLITITSSFQSIVPENLVPDGCHVACMGTDTKGKQEVDPDLLLKASRFTDELVQSRTIGECQHIDANLHVSTLGAVLSGSASGRKTSSEITLFDGTGVGLQDLACAQAVVSAIDVNDPSQVQVSL